jgi:hypothetical protein
MDAPPDPRTVKSATSRGRAALGRMLKEDQ